MSRAALGDTSRWQGIVDAAAIKAAGFVGIVARCTTGLSGSNQPDPQYKATQAAARAEGLIFGAYHVLFPVNRNPAGEAAAFATHAGDVDLIVLDLERTDGLPAQAVLDQARVWLIETEAHFGKRPVIYTGSWFWDGPSYVGPATPAGWEFQYDLWEAEYTRQFPWGGVDPSQAPIGQPMDLSDGFVGWKFWQWTSAGKPTGVQSGSLDYDVFNGTEAELRVYLGLAPPPATCEQQVAILNREAALRGWNLTP